MIGMTDPYGNVVAPSLTPECYNAAYGKACASLVVAPSLTPECYNVTVVKHFLKSVVAPSLTPECYNYPSLNPRQVNGLKRIKYYFLRSK